MNLAYIILCRRKSEATLYLILAKRKTVKQVLFTQITPQLFCRHCHGSVITCSVAIDLCTSRGSRKLGHSPHCCLLIIYLAKILPY